MLLEDLSNKLADNPALSDVTILTFRTDPLPAECLVIAPMTCPKPDRYVVDGVETIVDHLAVKIECRAATPNRAYFLMEAVRTWLDHNPPDGYLQIHALAGQADDDTPQADLDMSGGSCYREFCDFELIKMR